MGRDSETAREALDAFERWPTWMWANWEGLEYLQWLAEYNRDLDRDDRIGFYGLDVYGPFESLEAVVDSLEDVDPDAATEPKEAYRCFEPYGGGTREYDHGRDDYVDAEQNMLVVRNAEQYYREMARDTKGIVWADNTHVGERSERHDLLSLERNRGVPLEISRYIKRMLEHTIY